MTHTEAQLHIAKARKQSTFFVIVRTDALRLTGYVQLCGAGYLTLVHRHLL